MLVLEPFFLTQETQEAQETQETLEEIKVSRNYASKSCAQLVKYRFCAQKLGQQTVFLVGWVTGFCCPPFPYPPNLREMAG